MRFRTWADEPVQVEEITFLLLVGRGREKNLATKPGQVKNARVLGNVYPSLRLVAVTVDCSLGTDHLTVSAAGQDPLLILAVRYREARAKTCNWQEKVVLTPGTYKLKVGGESTATYPDLDEDLPDSDTVTWSDEQTIQINYPETLRPYIDTSTIVDSRIFDVDSPPREPTWNPTMHGFGFPIYQKYRGTVRFRVPYMSQIFSSIHFRLQYETSQTVEQDLLPVANAAGEYYQLDQSQAWIRQHCGEWAPDEEMTLTSPFLKAGPAGVRLYFNHPNGSQVKLDEWACYISQFDCFADHLAWPEHCVTVFYSAGGRFELPDCNLPGIAKAVINRRSLRGKRVDVMVLRSDVKRLASLRGLEHPWAGVLVEINETYPEELNEPPANWLLTSSLTQWLAALDAITATRFARFAAETGVRFNDHAGEVLDGINDTVEETTIEAVVDSGNRPYALWLRTPEPVDWRRVSVSLRIKHVEGSDCPTAYAKRNPLDLQIEILPSPDGSSAFLIGSFAGQRTRLPRGVYTLTLQFNTSVANLPTLKPTPAVGWPVEQVVYTFVQPSGENWPEPFSDVLIPAYLWERLRKLYKIPWPIIEELWRPRPDPRVLEKLLRDRQVVIPIGPGGPDPIANLAATVTHLENISERLTALADFVSQINLSNAPETSHFSTSMEEGEPPEFPQTGGDL